jgi:hypothetical protein
MLPFIKLRQLQKSTRQILSDRYQPNTGYPALHSFHNEKNKLEAVVLLVTDHEITSMRYFNFINTIIKVRNHINKKYDIDFIIGVNNLNQDPITHHVKYLEQMFRKVIVINNNIAKEDDIYNLKENINSKFGRTSGPNILFWSTLQQLNQYNTVLVVESDCIVYSGWLETLMNYVEYSGDFLISGSTYDGNQCVTSSNISIFFHLNGVALYKTGSPALQFLLQELQKFTIQYVANINNICAYDVAITDMILKYLQNSSDSSSFNFWKLVYRNIVKNTFIVNASLSSDANISEATILERFPRCVVLHKKLL